MTNTEPQVMNPQALNATLGHPTSDQNLGSLQCVDVVDPSAGQYDITHAAVSAGMIRWSCDGTHLQASKCFKMLCVTFFICTCLLTICTATLYLIANLP